MRKSFRFGIALLSVALLGLLSSGAYAQQFAQYFVLSNTTLSGAMTATQQTVTLTSASASAGSTVGAPALGDGLYVADGANGIGEFMVITSVPASGATFGVRRGVIGIAGAHPTSAVVFTGDQGYFMTTYPQDQTCTLATNPRPWINVLTGDVGLCKSSVWAWTNKFNRTINSVDPY